MNLRTVHLLQSFKTPCTQSKVSFDCHFTGQGPGTSFEFALKIVEYLVGAEKSNSLIEPMRLKLCQRDKENFG